MPDPTEAAHLFRNSTSVARSHLDRIEAAGFGGLTLFGGENFEFWIEGNNWCLLGQNGSGKTSLASAIMWALTGKRIREQDGPIDENGERAPVHAPDGKKIGDWPPVASYPASANELSKAVEVWVRLTFKNSKGELATALRRMICNPNGTATTERQIDPRLLSCPQLIETGLLMPARLVRIGFGDKSQSLYDAVKLLTGLDQLSDIADGCGNFTHAGRRFLKFGKDNGIDGFATRFEENIERGTAKAKELSFVLPADFKISDTDIVKSLRDVAESASSDAAAHLESLKSEIDSKIDISTQESRARIRAAVNAGDLVIVCNHAPVHPRNLVVARIGDALLARRFNTVEAHPEIAVLTGQSVDPTVLAEPMLIAPTTENCRKVVGTVFTARTLGAPAADPNREIVPLSDPTIVSSLLNGTRLFQVKGRSAEPIALDGQFLITRSSAPKPAELKALDGRLIVAVDENGARYFKRLRYGTQLMILESLNPDGTTAAEVLSSDGALGFPKLTHALEVIGVLFELPTS